MQNLIQFIKSKVNITEQDLKMILSKFNCKNYSKSEIILKRGQISSQYYFINSGSLRFFSGEFGNEHTSWAFFKGAFIAEISSLGPQKPTRFNIQAIEDTELLVIEKSSMEGLYKAFPIWQEFGRKLWEEVCIQQVEQNLNMQTLTAEGVYLKLMETPEFIQKIPIKHLASILGITPNALSRIRRNIK